jgi:hypothetical protein
MAGLTACLVLASAATAATPASSVLVTVDATANGNSAQYVAEFDVAAIEERYEWSLDEPVVLKDSVSGVELGTLSTLGLAYKGDPAIAMNFSLQSALPGVTFSISSALMSFAAISNPVAYATGGLTLTDLDHDQATLTGLLAGGAAYQGTFNNGPAAWASLFTAPLVAPSFSSVGITDRTPVGAGNWASVGYPVSSMQAQFMFQLNGADMASGTSMFEVVPEPSMCGLMLLGILFVLRRR